MILCPTCRRGWIPLGDEPAECPTCRNRIGMCALVGGEVRGEAERGEPKREEIVAKERP